MSDTKSQILDVAEELVQRVGLNAMSYQHISDAVGIRKASIHHHFPKKEHLVEALLARCHLSYGDRYQAIVDGEGSAPDKLRQLAAVFADGLKKHHLCLVGTISADLNTLQESAREVLEKTIRETVAIYLIAFQQGENEGSLTLSDTVETTAFAFYSFLLGTQITSRACGGVEAFNQAAEAIISGWEQ